MQKSAQPPHAHTSAHRNGAMIEGAFSCLLFLPLPVAGQCFLIRATSKKILLCFSLGLGRRVRGEGQQEQGTHSHRNRDCRFCPYIKSSSLVTGIKPEMQNASGHPIAYKNGPSRCQEPSLWRSSLST